MIIAARRGDAGVDEVPHRHLKNGRVEGDQSRELDIECDGGSDCPLSDDVCQAVDGLGRRSGTPNNSNAFLVASKWLLLMRKSMFADSFASLRIVSSKTR